MTDEELDEIVKVSGVLHSLIVHAFRDMVDVKRPGLDNLEGYVQGLRIIRHCSNRLLLMMGQYGGADSAPLNAEEEAALERTIDNLKKDCATEVIYMPKPSENIN